jgi:formylglycine-generating enzyme required for sulfatase activity
MRRGGGSATNVYSGSNTVDNVAWYFTNSGSSTKAVKGLFRNGYGLYDMSGNVYEWCWDWLDTYPNSAQTNPTGPGTGTYRVARSGSWFGAALDCRSAARGSNLPDYRYENVGFRLAFVP